MAILLHGSKSWCCREQSIIVQSRDGGFVTQNCEGCGGPRNLPLKDIPSLRCEACGTKLNIGINHQKNYAYSCPDCGHQWELASLVFRWDELFDYRGFGLATDTQL